jgi:hypothetical protein
MDGLPTSQGVDYRLTGTYLLGRVVRTLRGGKCGLSPGSVCHRAPPIAVVGDSRFTMTDK